MKKFFLTIILIPFLLSYTAPIEAAEKEERKWQDETIYFLMVDRFNDADPSNNFEVDVSNPEAYQGGDFQGIIDKLDYIKDMGFTAICLTPVFDNDKKGYHGYWIKDFYKTEEHFGSLDKFKELVKEAHKRDMKVIFDFIANHVGLKSEWVNDPDKQDWFHNKKEINNWNDQKELENGWLNGLPDLAQENPEVKNYLIDAAKWWIKETDIDGYRLHAVNHAPVSFWADFAKEIKKEKEDFYLLGEIWSNDPTYIAQYEKAGIDGFLDYPLNEHLRTAFSKPDQSLKGLFTVWERNKEVYENPYLLGTFMDNHDTVRFTRDAVNNNLHPGSRWKLALTYLYTTPGIPIVYYGSEIALDGGEDPDNRRIMDFRTDKELIDYISKIGELRDKHPSLTRGTMELLYEKKGMAVYKREYENETAVIAINNTSKSQKITLTEKDIAAGKELRGLLNGDLVRSENGEYNLIIDRDEAEIYFLAEKTGLNIPFLVILGGVIAAFILFLVLAWKKGRKTSS
ncbi:alpha-amlyase [Bacillus methanolicus]|uniref:alpha-amylase family glycosyl hydrolase n=1 Tax=Bacillus methanolicus TaxID=1471 RepID=UPI00237FF066|nr:alpha-amylase family glycosyl hydrolase [Bacillus methanolicus]MDE3838181.1 alpha-amlyase [Bacillus methanolicus]